MNIRLLENGDLIGILRYLLLSIRTSLSPEPELNYHSMNLHTECFYQYLCVAEIHPMSI